MNAAGALDWTWWTGGAAVALAAALLLGWALFWDGLLRLKGRGGRRCPRCWYDMASLAPALVCPECGLAAPAERALRRSRRRWGWAFAGVLGVGGGYVLWCVPRIRDEGWQWGFVPTSALLAATWTYDPDADAGFRPHREKNPVPLRRRMWGHAWERHRSGWMWGVQHRIWVHRQILPRLLQAPERWPAGHPLGVRVAWDRGDFGPLGLVFKITPRFSGPVPVVEHPSSQSPRLPFEGKALDSWILRGTFHEVGVPPVGPSEIAFDVEVFSLNAAGDGWERTWRTSTTRCIDVGGRPEDIRPAVRGPEADAAVRDFYRWTVFPGAGRWELLAPARGDLPGPLRGTTLGYRIEILHDGEVVASARHWLMSFDEPPRSYTGGRWDLTGDLARLKAADPADPAWRVRVTGDPLMALRDFKGERWWDGVLEWPLGSGK